jgi:hypothetical protein
VAVKAFRWPARELRVWLAAAILATVLGLLVGLWPTPSAVAFVLLAIAIGAVVSQEFAVAAILVSSLVMLGAMSRFGLPVQAALLTKFLIGLFVLNVFRDVDPLTPLRVPIAFIMLTAVLAVSAVFGAGGWFLALQALGAYLAAPIAYLAIIHSGLKVDSLKRLALIVAVIVAAQVPIMFVQSRLVSNVDDIGGTFGLGGSTQIQAVMLGAAWTIAVAMLTGRRRWLLLPIGLALAAGLIVSQAKAGFIFAAAGTVAVGLTRAIANPRRGISVLLQYFLMGAAAVAVLFGGYAYFGDLMPGGQMASAFWVNWLSHPSTIIGYLFSYDTAGQAGRLEGTRLVLDQSRTVANLLIGQGPGMLSGSALLGQDSASSSALGFTLSWATSATR